MTENFLYFISQSNGSFKCGSTNNPKQRFYTYNCHTGENLVIHFIGNGKIELEKQIQQFVDNYFGGSKNSGRKNEYTKISDKKLIPLITKNIVSYFELINPNLENNNALYSFVLESLRGGIKDAEKIRNIARRNGLVNKFGLSISTKDIQPLLKQAKYELKLGYDIPILYNDREILRMYLNGSMPKDIAFELYLPKKYVNYVLGTKYLHKLKCSKSLLKDTLINYKYISNK